MKQIFTLTMIALISVFSAQAQIKLTRESHGFKPGEEHVAKRLEYKAPGESGINVVWDFKDIIPVSEVNESPVVDLEDDDCNVGISRNDGVFFFYKVSDDRIEYKGYRKGTRTFYYSKPIVKIMYPETYGTSFEGEFSGSITNDGEPGGNISGTYSTNVDATGTILLPGNVSLPVIRSHTIERITAWGNDKWATEIVKYLWYAKDVRFPVFVSVEVANCNPSTGERHITERTSYLNVNLDPQKQGYPENRIVAGTDQITDVALKVSPNPVKDQLTISYSLPEEASVSIELLTSQGTKIATILPKQTQQGQQTVIYNMGTNVPNKGIYLLTVQINGKTHVETLIKQ